MYKFDEIADKKEWDAFVLNWPEATFFLSWNWGEFERLLGNSYVNYGVYDDGKLVGLIPVKFIRARRGKLLHLRHAPLLDWNNKPLARAVIDFVRSIAIDGGYHMARLSPLLADTVGNSKTLLELDLVRATSHDVDAEVTLLLDLTKSEAELLSEMRKNTRYYIKKAEKVGVTIVSSGSDENFGQFWKIFQDAVRRNRWKAYTYNYLKSEYDTFRAENQARLFFAMYKGEPIAASIFTYFNNQSVYHHSGSLTQFRDIPASYLLQWEAIKYAKSIGMKRHNLWGVSPAEDSGHPWYGLSLFKRGFGGNEVHMVHAHDLIISPLAKLTRAYEVAENWWRGY